MSAVLKRAVLAVGPLLVGTVSAFAQQATIAGTVTDSSGGVLPGVTITIVHEETGNTFEAVTDAQGQFPIPPVACFHLSPSPSFMKKPVIHSKRSPTHRASSRFLRWRASGRHHHHRS